MTEDTVVIYHKSCTDGLAAAGCAYRAMGENAKYIPMHYGEELDFANIVDKRIYILDFSFPAPIMSLIINTASHVTWLDHHKTAFEEWAGTERELYIDETEYTHIILDNNKSGAMLAWEHFCKEMDGEECPDVIRAIDDRDRWQLKLPKTKEINEGLRFSARTVAEYANFIDINDIDTLIQIGNILVRKTDQEAKNIMRNALFTVDEFGNKIARVNCAPGLSSEVGNQLCIVNPSIKYALTYCINDKEEKILFSLRSIGEFDVSAVAKKLGGGGHRNAAGYVQNLGD